MQIKLQHASFAGPRYRPAVHTGIISKTLQAHMLSTDTLIASCRSYGSSPVSRTRDYLWHARILGPHRGDNQHP
jgi:hypothetical protein